MCFTLDTNPAKKTSKEVQAYAFMAHCMGNDGMHYYKGILCRTNEGEYRTAICARQLATLDITIEKALSSFFYECNFKEIKQSEKWAYEIFFMRNFTDARNKQAEQTNQPTIKKVAESSL